MKRKIVVLKYGESVFGENYIFRGGNPENKLPITFAIYLIQNGKRNILVDAGCNDGAGFAMSIYDKPVNILKKYGLMPEDITDVIITHHHHDHIEAVKDYPNAVVHIQKDEYELGKCYIPECMQVELFDATKQLMEGLTIKKIGGHSIGSSIVLCNCDCKTYVFCGDECYLRVSVESHIPTGSSYSPQVSEAFVKEYSDKQYEVLLCHDPNILAGRLGYHLVETKH